MDLRHAFLNAAEKWGGRETVLEGERSYSRIEIAAGAAGLAQAIDAADRSETGNVGIVMPNCAAFIPAFYGSIFSGRIPVPLNPIAPPAELLYMIENAGIRTILTISHFRAQLEGLIQTLGPAGLGFGILYVDETLAQLAAKGIDPKESMRRLSEALARDIPEIACMIYSSGTTGRPKGVMLTHQNLLSNGEAVRERICIGEEDAFYGVLPFFHCFGLCVMHLALWTGARFVMAPRFSAADTLRAVQRRGITALVMVPQMWQILLGADGLRETNWSNLRICIAGGGPAPLELRKAWRTATGQPLRIGYGLTEFSPVVSLEVDDSPCEEGVGRLLSGVEAKIVNDMGEAVAAGQEGEVWVRGPEVMKGYFRNPEATREAIAEGGWLRTGDCGFLLEDGTLALKGRRKEIIIVAGENVHPFEIEQAIQAHPAVAEAAVVGIPDPVRGEAPKAFVVLKPDAQADAAQLRVFLRDRLTPYKIPREFTFAASLPRNALGKVLKRQL